MAHSVYEVIADAQNSRAKLAFGNPVLCTDWVKEMLSKYSGDIEGVSGGLTIFREPGQGINPLSDASMVIARLERYLGELERTQRASA